MLTYPTYDLTVVETNLKTVKMWTETKSRLRYRAYYLKVVEVELTMYGTRFRPWAQAFITRNFRQIREEVGP